MLDKPEVHVCFVDFCMKAKAFDVAVGRYVIMPDHVHLFVQIPTHDITLRRWVQSLRNKLGKALLESGIDKPHWQEGFFDHLLRAGESYAQKWEYVRQNPVRARLCSRTDEWPYQGEITTIRWA